MPDRLELEKGDVLTACPLREGAETVQEMLQTVKKPFTSSDGLQPSSFLLVRRLVTGSVLATSSTARSY